MLSPLPSERNFVERICIEVYSTGWREGELKERSDIFAESRAGSLEEGRNATLAEPRGWTVLKVEGNFTRHSQTTADYLAQHARRTCRNLLQLLKFLFSFLSAGDAWSPVC